MKMICNSDFLWLKTLKTFMAQKLFEFFVFYMFKNIKSKKLNSGDFCSFSRKMDQ